jgi:hypothetical protein
MWRLPRPFRHQPIGRSSAPLSIGIGQALDGGNRLVEALNLIAKLRK